MYKAENKDVLTVACSLYNYLKVLSKKLYDIT